MQVFTGKLTFVNQAPAGKKADSIVIKLMDGTDQRFYMTKGESKALLDQKGAILTVTVPKDGKPGIDGKVFLWTSKEHINIASEAPVQQTSGSTGNQTQDLKSYSIGYQALAKVAIDAVVHNAALKKQPVTVEDVHTFTMGLLSKLFDRNLAKNIKNSVTDTTTEAGPTNDIEEALSEGYGT